MQRTLLKIKASEMNRESFQAAYKDIYEHSPWITEGALAARIADSLDSVDGLHSAMMAVVVAAPEAKKMTLVCAHPDLAGKLAVGETLTADSKSEQAGAGLNKCNPEEFSEFQKLNNAYKEKFGFPFIIAVKGHDRQSILASFRARIHNSREIEFKTALAEVDKIALIRLQQLIEE